MSQDEKNEQYWLARLYDRDPESRVQAAKYFWSQKLLSQQARQALLGMLQDQDASVREWGIMALTRAAGPPGPLHARLLDLLRDRRGDVRWNTVAIVERMNLTAPEILSQLQAMIEDEDPIVRRFVARALGRLRRPARRAGRPEAREDGRGQLALFEVTWLERIESKEERILQVFREVIAERTDDEQLQRLVAQRMGLGTEQAARIVDTIVGEATRVLRDRQIIAQAVARRGASCQIGGCGFALATRGAAYAEGIYLPPPGRTPRRPEQPAYAIVLCPNHRKIVELAPDRKLFWDDKERHLVAIGLDDERLAVNW